MIFSQVFCDFGENFVVADTNGEQCITIMVSAITKVSIIVKLQSIHCSWKFKQIEPASSACGDILALLVAHIEGFY